MERIFFFKKLEVNEVTITKDKPLIVQGDFSILLDVHTENFKLVRDKLMGFAELVKSPEHMHVYRISPLSLWNAAAAGISEKSIIKTLTELSRYSVPANVKAEIVEKINRFGLIKLVKDKNEIHIVARENGIIDKILKMGKIGSYVKKRINSKSCVINPAFRGQLKIDLIKMGFPIEDIAGYAKGDFIEIKLREASVSGAPFSLRSYQKEAVDAFHSGGTIKGGSGVIVLPCGAGKTIVGIALMEALNTHTLILSTGITALRQWKRELLDKTYLSEDMIGEYSGEVKQIRPITISTYQIMTYRRNKTGNFIHLKVFSRHNWGLVIYDEVHLLPAPVFRFTTQIQAMRRCGLTATLVREDKKEDEVFSLIGPKKYDIPWRSLEVSGWISNANCIEVRVDLDSAVKKQYFSASARKKYRLASENPCKQAIVQKLVKKHSKDLVLIIGHYLSQLETLRSALNTQIITGKTPIKKREELYSKFRRGEIKTLIVSKVGNFAVDLPDANVAIQVSGTFGSRQEEAQRLGRILRPKESCNVSVFYSLVSRQTKEQEFAEKRQLFLTEQGYEYKICDAKQILETLT